MKAGLLLFWRCPALQNIQMRLPVPAGASLPREARKKPLPALTRVSQRQKMKRARTCISRAGPGLTRAKGKNPPAGFFLNTAQSLDDNGGHNRAGKHDKHENKADFCFLVHTSLPIPNIVIPKDIKKHPLVQDGKCSYQPHCKWYFFYTDICVDLQEKSAFHKGALIGKCPNCATRAR